MPENVNTHVGDLVLFYIEKQPAFFARIEAIEPDVKPEWFQVKLLVLQVPVQVMTWILREPYVNGETFTMGGHPVQMVTVVSPEVEKSATAEPPEPQPIPPAPPPRLTPPLANKLAGDSQGPERKVLSLAERRKKEPPARP
jgi:hypothetical protein